MVNICPSLRLLYAGKQIFVFFKERINNYVRGKQRHSFLSIMKTINIFKADSPCKFYVSIIKHSQKIIISIRAEVQ